MKTIGVMEVMEQANAPLPGGEASHEPTRHISKSSAGGENRLDDRFGRWLKLYRNRMGMTRASLARRINYSVDAIKKVENGQRVPSESMARLLAEALGITPEMHGVFIRFGRTNISHPAFTRMVQYEETASAPAPLTALASQTKPTRLPYPIKPLIDRASEINSALDLIMQKRTRLLTLHGAPGAGKTRLGLEISNLLRNHFNNNVYHVSLALVNSADAVAGEIANQLRLPLQELRKSASATLPDLVVEALRHKQTLLVLDNFEHVLSAASLICYLLEQTPALVIIVTSREPLGLEGEMRLAVSPLTYPSLSCQPLGIDAVASYPAVKMFVQEARTLDASFTLTEENYTHVGRICEMMQGLPLCLELVAGQLAHHSLTDILSQLDQDDFTTPLTRESTPGMPNPHHISLLHAIQWSYQKLKPIEQQLFSALSVFAAPVDEQALLAVAFDSAGHLETTMAPYVLNTLFNQHLIRQEHKPGRMTQYALMIPIRSVLRENLIAADVCQALQIRQVAYFEQLATRPESKASHSRHTEWAQQIDCNYYNIIMALEWCHANASARALHMAASLADYWHSRGYWHEGRRWLDQLIQSNTGDRPDVPIHIRARVLGALATFQMLQGESITAIDTANKSLALAESAAPDSVAERGGALTVLGDVNYQLDDYVHALSQYDRALEVYRQAGDRWHEANLLGQMGYLAHDQGDLASADRLINQSLIIWHSLADQAGIASALQRLAQLELLRGRSERAVEMAQQSLVLYRKQEDRLGEATAMQRLGAAWLQMGHLDRAESVLTNAVDQLQQLNSGISLAEALTALGRTLQLQGRISEAIGKHRDAIELAEQMHNRRVVSTNLSFLAGALMSQSQPVAAAKLLASASKVAPVSSNPISNVTTRHAEALKIEVRRHLTPLTFDTAWEEGLTLNLKQALAIL